MSAVTFLATNPQIIHILTFIDILYHFNVYFYVKIHTTHTEKEVVKYGCCSDYKEYDYQHVAAIKDTFSVPDLIIQPIYVSIGFNGVTSVSGDINPKLDIRKKL